MLEINDVVLYCIALRCVALRCIASYRIASHRIASHRIVSYRIVSYCIVQSGVAKAFTFVTPYKLQKYTASSLIDGVQLRHRTI